MSDRFAGAVIALSLLLIGLSLILRAFAWFVVR